MRAETLEFAPYEDHPALDDAGRRMLDFLREHPRAPRFHNRSGHRLLPEEVTTARDFEREVRDAEVGWRPGALPDWLPGFVEDTVRRVPFFRDQGLDPQTPFTELPTTDRGDLARHVDRWVPDDLPLDRLLRFSTSGTTGHPLLVPSHPTVAAGTLAFHRRALDRRGIRLRSGPDHVGVVLLGHQKRCFTYVSINPTLGGSGLVKLNLHPDDWHDPADRMAYLQALDPEVVAGDPHSFAVLAELPGTLRPKALFSTAMALLPGQRRELEMRFDAPVLDFYSLNEVGPVAVAEPPESPTVETDKAPWSFVVLQHRLYLEILDPEGHTLPPGQRGEVAVTGGFNPYLPLLRYRTGDFASLRFHGRQPILEGLEGRPPVLFRTPEGRAVPNLEVTHALARFALPRFTLHQATNGRLTLRYQGQDRLGSTLREALLRLFGPDQEVAVERVEDFGDGKVIQYRSDLEPDSTQQDMNAENRL